MTERDLRDGMGVVGYEASCAWCGTPFSEASTIIGSGDIENGEWTCSERCYDLHAEHGCPLTHFKGGQGTTDEEVADKTVAFGAFVLALIVTTLIAWALVEWVL